MPAFVLLQTQMFFSSVYRSSVTSSMRRSPRQSMQTKWMAPSAEQRIARRRTDLRKPVYSASDISPDAIANSLCFVTPRPETFPSIGTL
jgi:hypothetical protein